MQDEDIDKLIRDAASQHHPPYDDKGWEKMEQLLDKELPQKKDRRRPLFFLLLSLLVAGGAFYILIYPGLKGNEHTGNDAQSIAAKNNTPNVNNILTQRDPVSASVNTLQKTTAETITSSETPTIAFDKKAKAFIPNQYNNSEKDLETPASGKNANVSILKQYDGAENEFRNPANGKTLKQKGKTHITTKAGIASGDEVASNEDNVSTTEEKEKPVTQSIEIGVKKIVPDAKQKIVKQETATIKEEKKKTAETIVVAKNNTKKEKKKSERNPGSFGITASAGTDLSFVNVGSLGKATFMYGAGVSYDVSKHIKVRAGFYVSNKIYSTTPAEYNAIQYPNLESVNGNCKVYEIPVSVNYKFGSAKKHSWFAGAGLSSFIMKKEDYVYNYKTPSGSTYNYQNEYKDQNKHLFSVLNLSAGYQYDISKRVSVMAEPFVKIPLTGIGQGKVKLNSTGIMLTATVKPFNKKKK